MLVHRQCFDDRLLEKSLPQPFLAHVIFPHTKDIDILF